ncbi:MAG: acyltransferase family protein, partial [Dolichospermum sp.]
MSEKIKTRFLELDALRGIAAFSVVLFHYTTHYSDLFKHSQDLHFDFGSGRHGVELFFIISGFVILMSLENTKRGLDFIVGRLSRLYPVYWAAIIMTFLVVAFSKQLPTREVNIFQALFNLTMLQDFFKIPRVDGVYWTLSIELSFYILMFTVYKLGQLKNISLISLVWLSLTTFYAFKTYIPRSSLLTKLTSHINFFNHDDTPQLMLVNLVGKIPELGINIQYIFAKIFIFNYAHLFILGMTLYLIKHSGLSFWRCIILLVCVLVQRIAYTQESSWNTTIFVAAFVVIFYLAIQGYLGFIKLKPLLFLGNISYSLYLIHQNIGYVIIKTLYSYKIN